MNRRHLLAGAAALPFAGLAVDVHALKVEGSNIEPSAADDPAIGAVQRWFAAHEAMRHYGNLDTPDDDETAEALYKDQRGLWDEMLATPPTTAAGLALMLAAFVYDVEALAVGSHFHDPDRWYFEDAEGQGTAYLMLPALWRSPAAAELFRVSRRQTRRTATLGAKGRSKLSTRPSVRQRSAPMSRPAPRSMGQWSRPRLPAGPSARMKRLPCCGRMEGAKRPDASPKNTSRQREDFHPQPSPFAFALPTARHWLTRLGLVLRNLREQSGGV